MKTIFHIGNLRNDMCTTQSGIFTPRNGSEVCKLHKSIYGLKQASKSGNIRFDEMIKEYGFSYNSDEPCVYKKGSGSVVVFLVLYVDDILLIGNNVSTLQFVNILHERPWRSNLHIED